MAAKCRVCTKSVYPMDPQINLDGSVFHKPCAKCADCGCQITIANFAKNDSGDQTLLLCRTHYFKRFHEGGSYLGGEKFQNKTSGEPNKAIASMKNSAKCRVCGKSVYPMDPQINLDGNVFHSQCAKCADCKCQITISNFAKNDSEDSTLLLCRTHYLKRFHEGGGSFLGGEKFQVKNSRDVNAAAVAAAAASPVKSSAAVAAENDHVFNFNALEKGTTKIQNEIKEKESPVSPSETSSDKIDAPTSDDTVEAQEAAPEAEPNQEASVDNSEAVDEVEPVVEQEIEAEAEAEAGASDVVEDENEAV